MKKLSEQKLRELMSGVVESKEMIELCEYLESKCETVEEEMLATLACEIQPELANSIGWHLYDIEFVDGVSNLLGELYAKDKIVKREAELLTVEEFKKLDLNQRNYIFHTDSEVYYRLNKEAQAEKEPKVENGLIREDFVDGLNEDTKES